MEKRYELKMKTYSIDHPTDGETVSAINYHRPRFIHVNLPTFDQALLELLMEPAQHYHAEMAIQRKLSYIITEAEINDANTGINLARLTRVNRLKEDKEKNKEIICTLQGDFRDVSPALKNTMERWVYDNGAGMLPVAVLQRNSVKEADPEMIDLAHQYYRNEVKANSYVDYVKKEYHHSEKNPTITEIDTAVRHINYTNAFRQMISDRLNADGTFKQLPPGVELTDTVLSTPHNKELSVMMQLQEKASLAKDIRPGLYLVFFNPDEFNSILQKEPALQTIIKGTREITPIAIASSDLYEEMVSVDGVKTFLDKTSLMKRNATMQKGQRLIPPTNRAKRRR